jgi:anti-anti-sigma factor
MLKNNTQNLGKITVFHLNEDLPPNRVKVFTKTLNDLVESGRVHISLDLSGTREISLIGLVAISSIFNKCAQLGGSLKIVGLTPKVRSLFRETNLINTIEVYENSLEAIQSFRSKSLVKAKAHPGAFYFEDTNSFVAWDRLQARSPMN